MSESDYIEMYWNAQQMGATALTIYISVLTGYLVVAFVAGRALSRHQVLFVSTLFVVFALYPLWGVTQYWWTGEMAREVLAAGGIGKHIEMNWIRWNPAVIGAPIGLAGILGALKFMSDVRRGEDRG